MGVSDSTEGLSISLEHGIGIKLYLIAIGHLGQECPGSQHRRTGQSHYRWGLSMIEAVPAFGRCSPAYVWPFTSLAFDCLSWTPFFGRCYHSCTLQYIDTSQQVPRQPCDSLLCRITGKCGNLECFLCDESWWIETQKAMRQ